MLNITIVMAIIALILGFLAFGQGGWERLGEGFLVGGKMLINVLPLLLLAFTTAGLISVLISKETVSHWLGREAGWKGLVLGALAGALVPGGPYVFYPLIATFLVSGAEIGVVISFLAAKNLWTVSRLPLEVALIGPELTFIRYIVTFGCPILFGILANALYSRFTEKIRSGVKGLQQIKKD